MTYLSVVGDLIPDFIVKLIQLLGKTIYTNRWHVLRDLLFTSPIASHKFFWISIQECWFKNCFRRPRRKAGKRKR